MKKIFALVLLFCSLASSQVIRYNGTDRIIQYADSMSFAKVGYFRGNNLNNIGSIQANSTLTLGIANNLAGTIVLKDASSVYNATINPFSGATGSNTFTLPDVHGVIGSATLGTTNGGQNYTNIGSLTANSTIHGASTISADGTLVSGVQSTTTGLVRLWDANSSFKATFTPPTLSANITLTTPTSSGTLALLSDLSTSNIAGGTLGAIPYQTAANTTGVLAATSTANKILLSGASAAPTWSVPTFPNASATSGKIIKSDGTNWTASTETYAVPGTSGNLMQSDGTNWTAVAVPTWNQNTTGSAAKWTTARNLAGNSVDGSANVNFSNNFIVQGTADAGLSGAQFLGAIATGLLKNTTTTGILSTATYSDVPTPMTLLGDMLYGGASGATTRLVGNTAASHKYLLQTGTGSVSAAPSWSSVIDTLTKGYGYEALAAVDSAYVFEVREGSATLTEIRAIRVGGTSASINATRTRSGVTVDLLTANYATTTSEASAGTLQNTSLLQGDIIRIAVRAEVGTLTELFSQFSYTVTK